MTQATITEAPLQYRRPLGVWIFTVLHVVGAHTNIATAVMMTLARLGGGDVPTLAPLYTLSLAYDFISLFIIIGVWLGNNIARITLLVVTTTHFCLRVGLTLFYTRATGDDPTLMAGTILGSLLTVLMYLWYFRRPQTVTFFHQ